MAPGVYTEILGGHALSPRDLSPTQLLQLATKIGGQSGGEVLLDPQFYLPHSDHAKLLSHAYWPRSYQTEQFWSGVGADRLVKELFSLNASLGCGEFILPGMFAGQLTDDWFNAQRAIVAAARSLARPPTLLATIALGADVVRSSDAIHTILDELDSWRPDGAYVVCEHPKGDYLVDDPSWILNVLDLVAGLRLRGLSVVVGYASHQLLCAGLAGATAIASGNFLNVRAFPPEKFKQRLEDEPMNRATWYYCPQALTEYTLPYLDLAKTLGVLPSLAPPSVYPPTPAASLFAGAQPTSVGFKEPAPFRHYLECLRVQCRATTQSSFESTEARLLRDIDSAERLTGSLRAAGVSGQDRDFGRVIEPTRNGIAGFRTLRGPQLRRHWSTL